MGRLGDGLGRYVFVYSTSLRILRMGEWSFWGLRGGQLDDSLAYHCTCSQQFYRSGSVGSQCCLEDLVRKVGMAVFCLAGCRIYGVESMLKEDTGSRIFRVRWCAVGMGTCQPATEERRWDGSGKGRV